MSTLLMDDLDMNTQIHRRNLRTAWRMWFELKPHEFDQLVKACKLEWGESWLTQVLQC